MPHDHDDFAHALGQTLKFFGKDLDQPSLALWIRAFNGIDYQVIRDALLEHTKLGKFAPKPRDIYEIIGVQRADQKAALPPPKPQECKCPKNIADAWSWFIKLHSGHVFGSDTNPTNEQQEVYLHTVNHEARRLNMPDAIPDEFKLREVWGTA